VRGHCGGENETGGGVVMPTEEIVIPEIVQYPSTVLRTKTAEVTIFGDWLKHTVQQMFAAMREHNGIGLAANQIGVSFRIAVIHVPGWNKMVLVNPRITKRVGEGTAREGCLSVQASKVWVPVKRSKIVRVTYQDLQGQWQEKKCTGLLARCVQHEVDHLDGLTCLERSQNAS